MKMFKAEVVSNGFQNGGYVFTVVSLDKAKCTACRLRRNANTKGLDGGVASEPTGTLINNNDRLICLIQGLRQNVIPSDIPCSPTFFDE